MQNCKWIAKLATLGIAVVALASSLAPSKAQAEDPYPDPRPDVWITYTSGVTVRALVPVDGVGAGRLAFPLGPSKYTVAEIVVPDNVLITDIFVEGFVNLTNIVLHPSLPIKTRPSVPLTIYAGKSGLHNITCLKTMRDRIVLLGDASFHEEEWAILQRPVQWTELPNIEIKTLSTDNGKELEVIWREGNLQIADAVNGEWKDYSGDSPLRIPLWLGAKPQQFFRIRKGDD